MTLEEIKASLTEREFEFYQALKSEDVEALDSFGDDAVLLKKSIEAKLGEATTNQTKVRERALVVPDFDSPGIAPSQIDVLGRHAQIEPFRKEDIVRGNRVIYKATGGVHRVLGVDRKSDPVMITIEMFGKAHPVPRNMVSKVAPMEYDPRFRRKRKRPVAFSGQRATRHHDYRYDPDDS